MFILIRQQEGMVDQSRRDRVGLGLIGLGPCWEQVYRPAILRMQSRLTVRSVYDPVEARAKAVANEFRASVAGSLKQMLAHQSVQGVIVLAPGWCTSGILELIARTGKLALLASPVLGRATSIDLSAAESSLAPLENQHTTRFDDALIPELGLRFTPASCRFRELMVTRLGPAHSIQIDCPWDTGFEETTAIIDWCAHIMGSFPSPVRPTLLNNVDGESVDFEFPPHSTNSSPISSVVRSASLNRGQVDSPTKLSIECQRGRATLLNRTQIHWTSSSESAVETLNDERTEIEILIDQFCRRALGGLNPVGRLSEYARAREIASFINDMFN